VIDKVRVRFCQDGEMLFIGTMAYNFGASAICHQIGFSPMVGAYFAGLSLSFLPSQVNSKP
jgi:Kef-type K+ transport system membrane component KefB